MALFNVRIIQNYHVHRRIVVPVEADDLESAIEQQSSDEAPDFDDPRWLTGWDLDDENVVDPCDGEVRAVSDDNQRLSMPTAYEQAQDAMRDAKVPDAPVLVALTLPQIAALRSLVYSAMSDTIDIPQSNFLAELVDQLERAEDRS